jgi:hypothetical protein
MALGIHWFRGRPTISKRQPSVTSQRSESLLDMTRVAFTFDDRSLFALYSVNEWLMCRNYGEALTWSLRILWTLYKLREQGYTELIVRNPKTGEERIICWK